MVERKKRRSYPIVNRSHQYRFLALIISYNMILVVFLGGFLFVPDMIQLQDQSLSFELRAAAADKILNMHTRVWPVMLILIALIGLHSFRVFHRFVGPLYRFQRFFGQVRDGDLSQRVRLRGGDYLHDEEKSLNEMIDRIAEKIDTATRAGSDALGALDELKRAVGTVEGLNPIWEDLFLSHRRNLETLLETVRYFRLSPGEKDTAEGAEA